MRIDYEYLEEIIADIVLYIPKLKNACESVSELFYQNTMHSELWSIFQSVVTGYEDLYKTLQMTLIDGQEHEMIWSVELGNIIDKIPDHFVALSEEIKANNNVAIGDLINYEWIPLLEDVLNLFRENR